PAHPLSRDAGRLPDRHLRRLLPDTARAVLRAADLLPARHAEPGLAGQRVHQLRLPLDGHDVRPGAQRAQAGRVPPVHPPAHRRVPGAAGRDHGAAPRPAGRAGPRPCRPGRGAGDAVRVAVPRPPARHRRRRGAAARPAGPPARRGLRAVRRGRPGREDNLLARLAASQAGAGAEEQLGMAVLLFGAGFDSPASMVGLGTRLLLEHPRQAWILAADDELAPNAVGEILRYEPPVQLVARTALEPVELAGTMVEPGSMILGLVAAANRDPAQVKEPEVFDVAREKIPSLSFGAGPHYCLGAHLARMQGEALFPRLLRRGNKI